MPTTVLLRFLLLFLMGMYCAQGRTQTGASIFYTLNKQNGLSDNGILQMIQLRDGRLAIYTEKGINVYSGQHFDFVPLHDSQRALLPLYNGETHLYLDREERLWVKHKYAVTCIDLQRLLVVPSPLDSLYEANGKRRVEDLYIDGNHDIWTVSGRTLRNLRTATTIAMPPELGALQDLDVLDGHLYMFFGTGKAADYLLRKRRIINVSTAYGPEDAALYYRTSLIVRGPGNMYYQTRTSDHETIFLSYNTQTHAFTELYRCPIILNTLNVTPDNTALICSSNGYLLFDLNHGASYREIDSVRLPDGSTLSTGINTIYPDQQKGVWLGTYHDGLLYASSLFNLFDTKTIDIPVTPILTKIYLNGEALRLRQRYDGRMLMEKTPPYIQHLRLAHNQNTIAFSFCTMNYVRPRNTYYRYRLDHGAWHTAAADDRSGLVSDRGVLYLPFASLPAGEHTLQVQASTNPRRWTGTIRTIHITIDHSPWRWVVWAVAVVVMAGGAVIFVTRKKRHTRTSAAAGHPAAAIPSTLVTTTLSPATANAAPTSLPPTTAEAQAGTDPSQTDPDTPQTEKPEVLARAEAFVKQHIADTSYGVEELAIDLCMERTGLYKKITALTNDTPVAFIRNLRLDHAAKMLREGHYGVNEIAIMCGFASPSYFTKCFKQRYGVKPSEYPA